MSAAVQYITPSMSLGEALGLLDLLSDAAVTARRSMQMGRPTDVTALYRKLKSLLWLLQCASLAAHFLVDVAWYRLGYGRGVRLVPRCAQELWWGLLLLSWLLLSSVRVRGGLEWRRVRG